MKFYRNLTKTLNTKKPLQNQNTNTLVAINVFSQYQLLEYHRGDNPVLHQYVWGFSIPCMTLSYKWLKKQ